MLKSLTYSVTFPSTGRTLSADLKLDEGFWAVTGPNESGKSMIFEVARWLLFGTAALRGKADDYKTLKAKGVFVIKGSEIEIERSARNAVLRRNGEAVATGTKAVNSKVVEELGFGLTVFDIACSINQGEVEKLGDMKPTQRKAMVDSVLGLSVLDLVAKWAGEEATALTRQADGLQEQLAHPGVEPVKPEGYEPAEVLKEKLATATAEATELAGIEGWLANPMAKPEKPTTKVDLPAENLKQMAERRRGLREQVETLKAQIAARPEKAVFTAELLDETERLWAEHHKLQAERDWAAKNPPPKQTMDEVQAMRAVWLQLEEWAAFDRAVADVETKRAALEAVERVECPECKHEFALHADHAARLKAELELAEQARSDLMPNGDRPETPPLQPESLLYVEMAWVDFDEPRYEAAKLIPELVKPELAERDIPTYRRQIEQVQERASLASELEGVQRQFDAMADFEAMLAEREAYERALASWQTASAAYEVWLAEREQKTVRKNQLSGAAERRDAIAGSYQLCVGYDAQAAVYQTAADVYRKTSERITGLRDDAAEHRKVRDVMARLRGLIKQHVLPSLNLVASQLLWQMSGGQRARIVVDEDFNVMVDQQDLDTLSGSGKAIANLALRIALGQVLTNRIMSIMLADEIDASMDDFRAGQTADVLRMLEERISQVIVVSHKAIDAPHHIRLGGMSDDDPNLEP